MHIDTNAIARGQTSPNPSLAPELEQLLVDLKTQVGQKLDAMVTRVSILSDAEKQQLLSVRLAEKPSAGQRTLLAVLRDPDAKLVELTVRDKPIATLSNLPLSRDAQVQVLVTPRGLLILPTPAPASATTMSPSATPAPAAAAITPRNGAALSAGNNQSAAPSPPPLASSAAASAPASARIEAMATVASAASRANPTNANAPAESHPAKNAQASSTVVSSTRTATMQLPIIEGGRGVPSASTEIAAREASQSSGFSAAKILLGNAIAQALPAAQPLKNLLRITDAVQNLVARLPANEDKGPLVKLSTTLQQIAHLGIGTGTPTPDSVRQAVHSGGLFYERRLVSEGSTVQNPDKSSPPLSDRDIKGLLIQLAQWSPVQAPLSVAPAAQASNDPVAQLMMSLARLFGARQEDPKTVSASRQLARAVQELAEKSLAQVQLQQFRTLSTQLQDPSAPAQWHLDIPLKLPDGYGNLYLHLFEPRLPPEEHKQERQKKSPKKSQGRWRVFLQLELDDMGALAAEIGVQDNTVDATLWTDSGGLRERASAHLEALRGDLEQQGLVVADLRCANSPPPEQKIRLDYALVDIKT